MPGSVVAVLVAQISDFHVALPGSPTDRKHDTATLLARALAQLAALDPRPDLVLCTGDLVQDGSAAEYRRLAPLLAALPMPWYVIPGNHDDPAQLRAAFADRGYLPAQGRLCYVVEAGPLRLIALDTHVPGEPGGCVGDEQLAWLDARLCEGGERPTLVFMHHPPFRTGIVAMDGMGLADGEALAAVISRHPQVERVLCGHLHRPIVRRFAGTIASTCPSTGAQVALDLRPDSRIRMVHEQPGYQLHHWLGGAEGLGLVSHVARFTDGA